MAAPMDAPGAEQPAQPPGGATAGQRAEQLAPLTGIAVLVLGLAGLIVLEGPADRPELDAPRAVILAYFGDRDTVIFGSFLLMLAAVFFLWFVGVLRAVLRRAEGDVGRVSAIAYGGGVAAAAFMLAVPASNVAGALFAEQLSPEGAQTFYLFGDAFLYPAAMAAAVLVAATALVAIRTGALPRWLAWLEPGARALAADPAARVLRRHAAREPRRVDRAGCTASRPTLDGGDGGGASAQEPRPITGGKPRSRHPRYPRPWRPAAG